MNQADFEAAYERVPTDERVNFILDESKNENKEEETPGICKNLFSRFLSFFPILLWLPKYRWKRDLPSDIIAGLTVGIMTVPQGMAYASLAELPPVYGLYASFFSAFFYLFFGTSRHISVGVFAVCSLMVGSVRLRLIPDPIINTNENGTEEIIYPKGTVDVGYELTAMMVISSLTFVVGAVQVLMALCRLTFVTTYMTDQLVLGYTTGSAFHVLIAQFDKLFGVKIKKYEGVGMLFFMVRDVILALPNSPLMVLAMSAIGMAYLIIGRDYMNPVVKRFSPIPIPHELILVILATIFSAFVGAKQNYRVRIVDNIPQGLPTPVVPNFDLMQYMIADAIPIAIICYMFIISMAKLFAKKHKYKVDDNQELYAIGFSSILMSFFPTYPAGASLSRSSVCEASGVKTQLYIIFSSTLLFIVIAWLGPLLEPLPMCILACIVTVSLKSLFMQFKELPRLWKISRIDFAIWVVACAATVITDATKGLAISILFVLSTVLIREQWAKVYKLYGNSNRSIFKPAEIYHGLTPIGEHVAILKFNSPLHFANVSKFSSAVSELLGIEGREESASPTTTSSVEKPIIKSNEYLTTTDLLNGNSDKKKKRDSLNSLNEALCTGQKFTIVLDCSAIAYVDTMGADALKEAYLDGEKAGTVVLFADFTEPVLDTLQASGFFTKVPKESLFPNITLAIVAAGVSVDS